MWSKPQLTTNEKLKKLAHTHATVLFGLFALHYMFDIEPQYSKLDFIT